MKRSHYTYVAKQMALRHPDALKYTKEYILTGFMREINKDINNYLYRNLGLDFSSIEFITVDGEPIQMDGYSEEECTIHQIPTFSILFGKLKEDIPEKSDTHKESIGILWGNFH